MYVKENDKKRTNNIVIVVRKNTIATIIIRSIEWIRQLQTSAESNFRFEHVVVCAASSPVHTVCHCHCPQPNYIDIDIAYGHTMTTWKHFPYIM